MEPAIGWGVRVAVLLAVAGSTLAGYRWNAPIWLVAVAAVAGAAGGHLLARVVRGRLELGGIVISAAIAVFVVVAVLRLPPHADRTGPVDYYFEADQVTDALDGRDLRVRGFVSAGSIQHAAAGVTEFDLEEHKKSVHVRIEGPLPDTFREGAEVVAHGRLQGGMLAATEVLAKCPSNYDPATHKNR